MVLSFGEWIKLMRDRAGLSKKNLADLLQVTPSTIYNWEQGKSEPSLTPAQTKALCDCLGVDLEALASAYDGEVALTRA